MARPYHQLSYTFSSTTLCSINLSKRHNHQGHLMELMSPLQYPVN
jgi:hypothetical protein